MFWPSFFNLATACSAIVLAGCGVVWLATIDRHDTMAHYLSLSRYCHVNVYTHRDLPHLIVTNNDTYGLYTNLTLSVSSPPSAGGATVRVPSIFPRTAEWGDWFGIFLRRITWPGGMKVWTLIVNLVYPMALASILPAVWVVQHLRRTPRGFPVIPGRNSRHGERVGKVNPMSS